VAELNNDAETKGWYIMKNNIISLNALYRSTDVSCLFLMGALGTLAICFPCRVPHGSMVAAGLFGVGVLFTAGSGFVRRLPEGFTSTVVRTLGLVALFSFLDTTMKSYQLLLFPQWMDERVVGLERLLFGKEVANIVRQYANRYITEGLMYSYVAYCPLIPLVAFLTYMSKGLRGSHEYLLNLSVTFTVCFLGFILFPLASPSFNGTAARTARLDGGFFTWCANWIHANHHYPGGSLPSPHCAGSTVMLITLYRHHRKAFFVLMPTLVLVYIATVYSHFHYIWDGIAGVAVAHVVVRLTPLLARRLDQMRMQNPECEVNIQKHVLLSSASARVILIVVVGVVASVRAQRQGIFKDPQHAHWSVSDSRAFTVPPDEGKRAIQCVGLTEVGKQISSAMTAVADRLSAESRSDVRLAEPHEPRGDPHRALVCIGRHRAQIGFPRMHTEPHFVDCSAVRIVELVQLEF
jgi:hypothetical protein